MGFPLSECSRVCFVCFDMLVSDLFILKLPSMFSGYSGNRVAIQEFVE